MQSEDGETRHQRGEERGEQGEDGWWCGGDQRRWGVVN